jgi:hydroxymethylbilane synthase
MKIKLGTRGSKLALWQAEHVKALLEAAGWEAELVIYTTTGDKFLDDPLHKLGDKGLFTSRLHEALLDQEADIAVHSSKDIPTQLEPGIVLNSILKREDPRDVLLALSEEVDLDNQSRKFVIGTSSLRRVAFLRHFAPHFEIKNIRGNIDTRIRKMEEGEYDGIILAYAGVKRMGYTQHVVRKLNVHSFTPAVGQGAIGITCREDHPLAQEIRAVLNHLPTEQAVTAERSFLRKMEGGCHVPLFGLATVVGEKIVLNGGIAEEDGSRIIRETVEGTVQNAEALGELLASRVLNSGATQIIDAYAQKN